MQYSQKYCVVAFLNEVPVGFTFDMHNWPLHVTLADVFAINREQTEINIKLINALINTDSINIFATNKARLGNTPVLLVDKSKAIVDLHHKIVGLLEENGAIFNTPEYINDGFLPHCTIQNDKQIALNKEYIIQTISLVDMYPEGNWQNRKVLAVYNLSGYSDLRA